MMPTASSQRLGVGDLRHDACASAAARPIDRRDEHLDQVAKRDHADQPPMISSIGRKPQPLEHQDAVGDDRGDDHAGEQRHVEQQRQADGAAEELGEIGRHRGDLADDPHRPDHRPRKMLAAQFGEVAAGDDAELGRQRLEQHRDEVGEQHHPEQPVAVFRAGLDVGGEIAGVHVGDRGDHRRAGEGQIGRASRRARRASTCRAVATRPLRQRAGARSIGHRRHSQSVIAACCRSACSIHSKM